MGSKFGASLMYGEVGTKVFCRNEPSEGRELLIGCVSAERGRSSKGHRCFRVALCFNTLSGSKRRLKKRMRDCAVR